MANKPTYEELEHRIRELEESSLANDKLEGRIESIFDLLPDLICYGNLDGYFTKVNPSFERSLGYPESEFYKREFLSFIHEDDIEITVKALADAQTRRRIYVENRYKCKDGSYRWMEWHVRANLKDRTFLAIGRDITKRRQAEEALQASEEKYRTLAEHSPDSIARRDIAGRIIYVNPQWEKSTGKSAHFAIGKKHTDILPNPKSEFQEKIEQVIATGENADVNLVMPDLGEGIRYHNLRFVAERNESGEIIGVLIMGRDLTESKQAEQQLREKQQRLNDLAQEVSISRERELQRIANDLHDTIGQELTLAKIKMGILNKTDLSEQQREILDDLKSLTEGSINRVRRMTKLLCPPILTSAGLDAALKWLARQVEDEYSLHITFNDDLQDKQVRREYQMEIYDSVRELLINVAKHAKTADVGLSVSRKADKLVIVVEDNGTGFDADSILSDPDIDAFGLFIIKSRLEHMNGRLEISSKPGVGTKATIRVPLDGK